MKNMRNIWITEGRPRGNTFLSYRNYKSAKCLFRNPHRKNAEKYMKTLNEEIDTAAEVDNGYFWKLVNRRKSGHSSVGSTIKFDGNICRAPDEICEKWGDYFSSLYSEDDPDAFDSDHYREVTTKVDNLKNRVLDVRSIPPVTDGELFCIISNLQNGKAPGEDCIYNEHFKYGGTQLRRLLLILVNAMLNKSYVPEKMKVGVIITLFKGGKKRKDDPNSYRAITLTSTLLKLYERVLHNRLTAAIPQVLNPLQGGFQKQMGCNMTSFLVQESINYAREKHSKLYVCFLDVKQAFDNVWHDGLFLKLDELGIDLYIWKAIVSLYDNITSYVNFRGFKSRLFRVFKGTRQGGATSPFFYLCFENDLMNLLCACLYGFRINGLSVCCPTVADDMALISLTKYGLQQLMNICYRYSLLWRYLYNALKCAILVFNESSSAFSRTRRQWYLGDDEVLERTSYVHLGIECKKEMTVKNGIIQASSKIRQNYFWLLNSGIDGKNLHPLTLKKLYEMIVLPRALYGCEFWHNMTHDEVLMLERSHRLCVKSMQGLDRYTRSCVALSLIGSCPLEQEIRKKKMILFGQLSRLDPYYTFKRLFMYRVVSMHYFNDITYGFVLDALNIIAGLDLNHVMTEFINIGIFPSKYSWKALIRSKLCGQRDLDFESEVAENQLDRFIRLHPDIKPNYFWELSKRNLNLLPCCRSVIQLIGILFNCFPRSICPACGDEIDNIVEHVVLRCPRYADVRHKMWLNIWNNFGVDFYVKMASIGEELLLDILLGNYIIITDVLARENMDSFYRMIAGFLHTFLRTLSREAHHKKLCICAELTT